ncbi:ubiquinol-cytochrome C chaperone family protein [Phenylobacterium sp.]|uniref:ubiquinol-cytochrome C chaperone family protein n=1 Tax=Phenylobacterium sp. TaxID=1871053 RepID=UPI00301DD702
MLKRLFKPRPAVAAGRELYAVTVAQARTPGLYADLRVADSPEGRFELYSLHVYLLLERLKGQGDRASEIAQALFDTYVSALDHALRELGVGDLSVGKKMRKLGEAFYGRVKSLEEALASLPDRTDLEAVLARTVYEGGAAENAPALADYVLAQRQALATQDVDAICSGAVAWAKP